MTPIFFIEFQGIFRFYTKSFLSMLLAPLVWNKRSPRKNSNELEQMLRCRNSFQRHLSNNRIIHLLVLNAELSVLDMHHRFWIAYKAKIQWYCVKMYSWAPFWVRTDQQQVINKAGVAQKKKGSFLDESWNYLWNQQPLEMNKWAGFSVCRNCSGWGDRNQKDLQ